LNVTEIIQDGLIVHVAYAHSVDKKLWYFAKKSWIPGYHCC